MVAAPCSFCTVTPLTVPGVPSPPCFIPFTSSFLQLHTAVSSRRASIVSMCFFISVYFGKPDFILLFLPTGVLYQVFVDGQIRFPDRPQVIARDHKPQRIIRGWNIEEFRMIGCA